MISRSLYTQRWLSSAACATATATATATAGIAAGRTQTTSKRSKVTKFRPKRFCDTFGTLNTFEAKLFRPHLERHDANSSTKDDYSRTLSPTNDDYDANDEELNVWTQNFQNKKHRQRLRELPVITVPKAFESRQRKTLAAKEKARQEYEKVYGVDKSTAKLSIECARSEYNHYEGMRYPTDDFPLVSDHWTKCKYKNDWFTIKPTTNLNPSFNMDEVQSWEECAGLINVKILDTIRALGYRRPTVVQHRTFIAFRRKAPLLIAAETGSGKTLAYAAPLISELMKLIESGESAKAIVIVPTHPLRIQVAKMIEKIAMNTGLKVVGADQREQSDQNWHILISTPCPVKSITNVEEIKYIIMDEADMLLDQTFYDQMQLLISSLRPNSMNSSKSERSKIKLLFSTATCPDELQQCIEDIIGDGDYECIQTDQLHNIMPHIKQQFIRVREMDKINKLIEMLNKDLNYSRGQTLVFCKSSKTVRYVSLQLKLMKIDHVVLMGGSDAANEIETLVTGTSRVIVATDVASRGLDLPEIRHVINYDFARQISDYVHRAGRIGRISGAHRCLITSMIRCAWEIHHVNSIERAARLGRPLEDIQLNDVKMIRGNQKQSKN